MQDIILNKLVKNNDLAMFQLINLEKNIEEIETEIQETEK